jgi:undecaprenyl phosphate-alpha-L-ara4N flippase subunit ArnF
MGEITQKVAVTLVAISVVLTSVAQLLFKLGMASATTSVAYAGPQYWVTLLGTANLALLAVGVALYGLSMLSWIVALTRLPVSLAYPMLSMSYLIVYLAATLSPQFGESGSLLKLIGVTFVIVGIGFVYSGNRTE